MQVAEDGDAFGPRTRENVDMRDGVGWPLQIVGVRNSVFRHQNRQIIVLLNSAQNCQECAWIDAPVKTCGVRGFLIRIQRTEDLTWP